MDQVAQHTGTEDVLGEEDRKEDVYLDANVCVF